MTRKEQSKQDRISKRNKNREFYKSFHKRWDKGILELKCVFNTLLKKEYFDKNTGNLLIRLVYIPQSFPPKRKK